MRVCSSKIKESRRMRISHARSKSQERQITPHDRYPASWAAQRKEQLRRNYL